jgi:hypothetical protein
MACLITSKQTRRGLLRRATWLLFSGLLLGSMTGCTAFGQVCSEKWITGNWIASDADLPVDHMMVFWNNELMITQDNLNGGAPLPGLVGRLQLLNEDTGRQVEAHGKVMVCMFDMTPVPSGKPAIKVAEWSFDEKSLKQLKKKKIDTFGGGYTLFLPWDTYRPDVKQVQLQVAYIPTDGPPRYGEPSKLTLQTDDLPKAIFQEKQVVPALQHQAAQQQLHEAVSQQPQALPQRSGPVTQVSYGPRPEQPILMPGMPLPPR